MTVSSWSGGIANGVACIPLTIAVRGNPQSNGHKIVRYVTSWIGAVTTSTKRCPQAHREGARYSTEFGQHSTYCGRFGTFVPIVEMMSQQLRRPSISPAAGVEDPGLAYRPVGVNPWSGAECITAREGYVSSRIVVWRAASRGIGEFYSGHQCHTPVVPAASIRPELDQ